MANLSIEKKRKRKHPARFLVILVVLVLAFIASGFVFLNRDQFFKSGTLSCWANPEFGLSEAQVSQLGDLCSSTEKYAKNYAILPVRSSEALGENALLADILLPTTTFYDSAQSITNDDVKKIEEAESTSDLNKLQLSSSVIAADFALTSINDLRPERKVLALDGDYYFDDYKSGAYFVKFELVEAKNQDGTSTVSNDCAEYNCGSYTTTSTNESEANEILGKIREKIATFPTKDTVLSINQTGVTALSRGMQSYLNKNGGDGSFFAEKIADFLSKTDFTHISNEVSFSDDCSSSSGSVVLCSPWNMYPAITAIGTDIVELTGNHNNDWSTSANLDTLKKYEEDELLTFGGGKDEESAKIPLELSEKDTHITWIGINNSTSTKANGQGASGNKPGANIYDEATTRAQISAAKEKGNFVLVDVQYSECYSYPAEGAEMPSCDAPIAGQKGFFRSLIDMGADMVVGTQAHQPQTYEIYDGKPIYYGLGNLFFDQIYWPGTTRGIILTHYFYQGKLLQTRLSPTQYGSTYQTALMDESTADAFLARLLASSPEEK